MKDFSVAVTVFGSISPTEFRPKLESALSKPAAALSTFCGILNALWSFQQTSKCLHQEWILSQEITSATINLLKFYHETAAIQL